MARTPVRPPPRRRVRRARPAVSLVQRHVLPSEGFAFSMLAAASAVLAVLTVEMPSWVRPGALVLPVVLGSFLLRLRTYYLLLGVVAACLLFEARWLGPLEVRPGVVTTVLPTTLVATVIARSRARLGVQGVRGESMLIDLRDRLRAQGEVPPLPRGWEAEVVLRSAGGASFSGDFLVSTLARDGCTLEVALVDVSGKGVDAGTRALLLSGAFGGLLGAMPGGQFLPAANSYLLRQDWEEGFATAVHLALDLTSGDYVVSSAGHPPAAQFDASTGRWHTMAAEGPMLGLLPDAEFVSEAGRLARGDALLLYTDGVIEVPGRDIAYGIDRLLGEAERLVPVGFRHGARRLVDTVAHGPGDDRALVMIWRT